jgi:hypothetical protein
VAGCDLHITQISASVEHGRDVGVTEHMRMCPGDLKAGGFGEAAQAAGGCVPVHPGAAGEHAATSLESWWPPARRKPDRSTGFPDDR